MWYAVLFKGASKIRTPGVARIPEHLHIHAWAFCSSVPRTPEKSTKSAVRKLSYCDPGTLFSDGI